MNAVTRLLSRNEPLDAKTFRPGVQFRYQRELEPPEVPRMRQRRAQNVAAE